MHAGTEIGEDRANAIKICGAVLDTVVANLSSRAEAAGGGAGGLAEASEGAAGPSHTCIMSVQGGSAINAIPTECIALIGVSWLSQCSAAWLRVNL